MLKRMFMVAALSLIAGAAYADADPAAFGGGSCEAMAQRNDAATLWTGRFSGVFSNDGGRNGSVSRIACFTDRERRMAWVSRVSGGGYDRIIQFNCRQERR